MQAKNTSWWSRGLTRAAFAVAIVLGTGTGEVIAQAVLDLCGCAGTPGLTAFDASDPSTYPPGTTGGCAPPGPCNGGSIVLPLPPDGVLRFSSFRAVAQFNGNHFNISFAETAAARTNTPVTILVAGDVELRHPNFCCSSISVNGSSGSAGGNGFAGVGGQGGPGGFRGGDGAALGVNLASVGGAGQGPGGGAGATLTVTSAGGTFFGVPELVPLVGGSGGGGGGSRTGGTGVNCTGGGGGGGGGAILLVANGTFTMQNFDIFADGGEGGSVGNGGCDWGGSGGSAGAIRVVANRFVHQGTARLFARGGSQGFSANAGTPGRIRIESVDSSAQTSLSPTPTSAALRITGPGPVANPVAPSVAITHVNGTPVPVPPQGYRGSVDLTLGAPGVVSVDIATTGVPSGTTIAVTSKPRIGAAPQTSTVPLTSGNCNAQGECVATATFNLNAGATVLEARATFQVQP